MLRRYRPLLRYDSRERHFAQPIGRPLAHPRARRGDRVYGHTAREAGRTWLQYWLFYADNPQDRGIFRTGRHEGDWELVQIRINAGGRPDFATLAQHGLAEGCTWRQLEHVRAAGADVPVVYVANASHASYSRTGTHDRPFPDPNDEADGRGRHVRPDLETIDDDSPGWVSWPGRWGRSRAGIVPGEQSSPPGPRFREVWTRPASFHRGLARACGSPPPGRWWQTPFVAVVALVLLGCFLARRRSARSRWRKPHPATTVEHMRERGARRALVVGTIWVLASPAAAQARPDPFFGLQVWNVPSSLELARMSRAGAGTARVRFGWNVVEPQRGARNWKRYDDLVAAASRAGVDVLPVILSTPPWIHPQSGWPPTTHSARASFSGYVRRLVARYGPKGGYLEDNPGAPFRPIRSWQVWNEPNIGPFWTDRTPNARAYVSLLKLTRNAIKAEDPLAKVVLAGLAESRTGASPFLKQIYAVRGARLLFDSVALHPYSKDAAAVDRSLTRARRIMDDNLDFVKPLVVTELGWASKGPAGHPFVTTQTGQANRLKQTLTKLRSGRLRWRLKLVTWFSLRDRLKAATEREWWGPHTGLFSVSGKPKPAWNAFTAVTGGDPGLGSLDDPQPADPSDPFYIPPIPPAR